MSTIVNRIRIDVAPAFAPLLAPARYKGAYGGRGGAKSHFFAEQIVHRCFSGLTRVVCIREIQKSLRDSVRQLLIDKIKKLGLGRYFHALEAEIRCVNGSLIIFQGMQSHNAETIKSLEGYDIAWVEEAQTLTQHSLDLLRPTIRKPGSEIWFSWNPRYRTDPVDVFFRKRPPEGAVAVFVNWPDNPWFPEVLRKDMEADRDADQEMAEHIWDGAYGVMQGAILGRLVDRAEREGRVHDNVEYDPKGPGIEVSNDLGFRDTTSMWFWQRRVGGFAVIDHDHDAGLDADDWCDRLEQRIVERGWKLGRIWLPHDAKNRTFQSKHTTRDRFRRRFGSELVKVVAQTSIPDRINAGRHIITTCEFNKTRCEAGLDGLRAWEYEWDPEKQVFSKNPLHNWASHHGDGFTYGCQVMQGLLPPDPEDEGPLVVQPETPTFLDLMKRQPKPSSRI